MEGGRKEKQGSSGQKEGRKGTMAVQHQCGSVHTFCPWGLSASCCKALDEEVTSCEGGET